MKKLIKVGFVICLIVITSCSTTKNIESSPKEGNSFNKAVVVKSVAEEYEYVKKVCSGCKMVGQSLVFEDKKPYDILKLKKANGEEISYYFDISKFYGKGLGSFNLNQ